MRAGVRGAALGFGLLLGAATAEAQTAFMPGGPTVTLAAGLTTTRAAIQVGNFNPNVRVYNAGTVAAFIACGDATVVATVAASLPIAPGATNIIRCPSSNVAGIVASGTASVYLTPGEGGL